MQRCVDLLKMNDACLDIINRPDNQNAGIRTVYFYGSVIRLLFPRILISCQNWRIRLCNNPGFHP